MGLYLFPILFVALYGPLFYKFLCDYHLRAPYLYIMKDIM